MSSETSDAPEAPPPPDEQPDTGDDRADGPVEDDEAGSSETPSEAEPANEGPVEDQPPADAVDATDTEPPDDGPVEDDQPADDPGEDDSPADEPEPAEEPAEADNPDDDRPADEPDGPEGDTAAEEPPADDGPQEDPADEQPRDDAADDTAADDRAEEAEEPDRPEENDHTDETEDSERREEDDRTEETDRRDDDTTADENERREEDNRNDEADRRDDEADDNRADEEDRRDEDDRADQDDTGADDPDNVERERELKPNDPRWDGPWNSTTPEARTEQPATAAEVGSTESAEQEPERETAESRSPQETEPNRDNRQESAPERDAAFRDQGDFERERELAPRSMAEDRPSASAGTGTRIEQPSPSQEIPVAETGPEIAGTPDRTGTRSEIPGPQQAPREMPVIRAQEQAPAAARMELGARESGAGSSEVRLAAGAETRSESTETPRRGPEMAAGGGPPDGPGDDGPGGDGPNGPDGPGGPGRPESRIPEPGPNDYVAVVNERGELVEKQRPEPTPRESSDKANRDETGVERKTEPALEKPKERSSTEMAKGAGTAEKVTNAVDDALGSHASTELRTGHEHVDALPAPADHTAGILATIAFTAGAAKEVGLDGIKGMFSALRGDEPSMMPEEPTPPEEPEAPWAKSPEEDDEKK